MEEQNEDVQETPAQDSPVEETTEEVSQEPANEPEPVQEGAEAPSEPLQEERQAQYEPDYDIRQFSQTQPQQPQFTPDEDGYIDPNQFYNRVLADAEARIEQKLQFQESERKAWQSVETKYPEIQQDPELRDLVNAQRLADVARGGKGDLNQIAGKVLGKIQSYQTKGKAQAQVSEKVQKSAGLQQATSNRTDTGKDSDLIDRMSRGDESAKEQLISEWLESGKL
jgi:hypothetical protein